MTNNLSGSLGWWRTWSRALRLRHWAKNLLVFLPLIGLGLESSLEQAVSATQGFFSLSLAASSVYLLNDVADRDHDRKHPQKRFRPVAAGQILVSVAVFMGSMLAVAAVAISFTVSWRLAVVVALYGVGALVYGALGKRLIALDVVMLAGLFLVRIYAGSVAAEVPVSHWLLATAFFAFFGLASAKRVVEIQSMVQERRGSSGSTVPGRSYRFADRESVQMVGIVGSFSSVILLTLFIDDRLATSVPSFQMAWLGILVWVAWLSRFWILVSREAVSHDPIEFVIKDWPSLLSALSITGIFLVFG